MSTTVLYVRVVPKSIVALVSLVLVSPTVTADAGPDKTSMRMTVKSSLVT